MALKSIALVLGAGLACACGSDEGGNDGAGGSGGSGGSAGSAQGDAAELVTSDVPATLACGEQRSVSIVMKNSGTTSWTAADGYKLGAVDDSDPLYSTDVRVPLGPDDVVSPGQTHAFSFELVAPAAPGSYTTDWRMVKELVHWFGDTATHAVAVTCQTPIKRTGIVGLSGNSLVDDQGSFNALGATLMWAAWGYRHDLARLEQSLDFLSKHGFDYIRALGVVGDPNGSDYWDGREIDDAWPDYDQVIAGLTDLAYDVYGLRVEWTLIGDGQVSVPSSAERYALADRFLAMSQGREHKIIHFEIANEAWQNGFPGQSGVDELRALSSYMKDATPILVAASAPAGHDCSDAEAIYGGGVADIATLHFDRDIGQVEGPWRPVRQPWEHENCVPELPVGSNNEPIGPGASVNSESDPERLVAAAITTYVSNLPLYVFHSSAGVRGDEQIWDMPGADAFVAMKTLVPPDLASWTRKNAHWPDSPFVVYAGENGTLHPDTMWVDLANPESGVVRAYGGVKGSEFFVFPIGILNEVVMEPRQAMTFDVVDPLTGATLATHTLSPGQTFELSGKGALILRGAYQ